MEQTQSRICPTPSPELEPKSLGQRATSTGAQPVAKVIQRSGFRQTQGQQEHGGHGQGKAAGGHCPAIPQTLTGRRPQRRAQRPRMGKDPHPQVSTCLPETRAGPCGPESRRSTCLMPEGPPEKGHTEQGGGRPRTVWPPSPSLLPPVPPPLHPRAAGGGQAGHDGGTRWESLPRPFLGPGHLAGLNTRTPSTLAAHRQGPAV